MRMVIDTEIIKDRIEHEWGYEGIRDDLDEIFEKHGTPLPKGYGKLIDADKLIKSIEEKSKRLKNLDIINGLCGAVALIYEAEAVIEADMED